MFQFFSAFGKIQVNYLCFCFLSFLFYGLLVWQIHKLTSSFLFISYYHHFTLSEFFTSASAGGHLLESEWQRVSSGFQDSSQYFGCSQQSCSLDDLNSFSNFQFIQPIFKAFGDHSKCTKYNWYHCHSHVPQLFYFSGKIQVFVYLFAFIYFHPVVDQNDKIHLTVSSFFLLINIKSDLLAGIR